MSVPHYIIQHAADHVTVIGKQWCLSHAGYNKSYLYILCISLNTLRLRQNGRHFPEDIFKWILLIENVWISINISLQCVSIGPINNIPTLVQVMAWRRPGDKPLSEPTMVRLSTHICVTQPQWVKWLSQICWCLRFEWRIHFLGLI